MTDTAAVHLASYLGTVLSLLLLWILVAWLWVDYRVDFFRHRLFGIRAELFDIALRGDLAFDDPAYTTLRTTLNGFLRFADRVGFLMLVMAQWTFREDLRRARAGDGEDWNAAWQRTLEALPPDVRVELNGLRTAMHYEVAEQIAFSSPLLTMTTLPIIALALIRAAGSKLLTPVVKATTRWRRPQRILLERLDAVAFKIGADGSELQFAA